MKSSDGSIRLAATDLSNHLACRHLTSLDLSVAKGLRAAPDWQAPDAWVLQQRGLKHESGYLRSLEAQGLEVVSLHNIAENDRAFAETMAAMKAGIAVIAQATLREDQWFGRADVLRRVEKPSDLGAWSYEVYDCKLAQETKAGTILQLSLYSELVASIQGARAEWMFVVTPGESFDPEPYRIADYGAYYRLVKSYLEIAVSKNDAGPDSYPDPTPNCEVCRWRVTCEGEWRRDDHLSLVAGISKLQRKQLAEWDTNTMAQLAQFPLPITRKPAQGTRAGYTRTREQARIQVQGRILRQPVHEVLEIQTDHGFCLLPEPSEGDVFFDLEGDPFVEPGGREYLFGMVLADSYASRWGLTPAAEKAAFDWFVRTVMERWSQFPSMHVYHYAPYEPAALKRLMGRHRVHEDEIDSMLRANLFVDLHTVVRRSIRASVEHYTLKALEDFHGYRRNLPLDQAGSALRQIQHGLELGGKSDVDHEVRRSVALYNADDCFSTQSLRDWLEHERSAFSGNGLLSRPPIGEGAPSPALSEKQQRVQALSDALTKGLPEDAESRNAEDHAKQLLVDLLDWHRREMKSEWWEYFRLKELAPEDLLDERSAIYGLRFVETVSVKRNIPTDRYQFDKQETAIRAEDAVCERGERIGEVVAVDVAARTIDIKKMKKTASVHPTAVFVDGRGPTTDAQAEALFRIGAWVHSNSLNGTGSHRAARDLLLRLSPRFNGAATLAALPGETMLDVAKRVVLSLNHSVLAIQGPPGAGKTYIGARMICELVRNGRKVGITAMSHKVIRLLLDGVVAAAREFGLNGLKCMQKVGEIPEGEVAHIAFTKDNEGPLEALQSGTNVVAGTAWLWARPEYLESVDVLFVDEAGQMSLANVLAVSQAAKSVVLLGDPQQLEQPLKGSHPEGAEASALEHLLGGAKTMPDDKGLFLKKTWRLHPNICDFTSELFYESRLKPQDGLDLQKIQGHSWLGESGLWFIPVNHQGNQNSSSEEVEVVAGLVDSLVHAGVSWIDDKERIRPLHLDDVLIVAPYNAQVSDLAARLPHARIGTVDKFQGQEAPVVIYSLTSSSQEDAPRGMEFLYSLNRLNVATSRARAMVILVASPRLLEPECRTPRQMRLANALCRYVELAQVQRKDDYQVSRT